MDFILPNDDTMELMREEFAKIKTGSSFARAYALANNENAANETEEALKSPLGDGRLNNSDESRKVRTYIGSPATGLFLLLYFVKHLGYNISYGTQIFNSQRGMEQLRPIENHFGQLNDLD